ncbi:chorismate lyase [Alteromonas sp. C1M14]|uniref:chorismate--pyruvate lyase family protein n=1 Tax=Alteromonas sp. C1M14 TaxID=2841567 RepID=UPI001C089C9B|nr:chorismate lyase [Alteromonas sp. C1M14]MBU2979853.1 chorismate lyase [Alteromonas sp. C1M14]
MLELAYSFPVGIDTQWQDVSAFNPLSAMAQSWLLDTGSLTERIESMADDFAVHVVGEGDVPLHANETNVLKGPAEDYRVREVFLHHNHTPWVFARSVIPQALVTSEFAGLGNQPLGKRLFNDARFSRGEFELCQVCMSSLFGAPSTLLWGRRSCFHFQNLELLVAEIFLPTSPIYEKAP